MPKATTTNQFITPQELKEKLDAGEPVAVVDVREQNEFTDWHIPESINIPLAHLKDKIKKAVSKDRAVIAVCAHGARSERARHMLAELGYNAQTLKGGMVMWNSVYDISRVPLYFLNQYHASLGPPAELFQFRRVGKGCISYLLTSSDEALVIDPTIDVDVFIKFAHERGMTIRKALDTHIHADHISGGPELSRRLAIPYFSPASAQTPIPHDLVLPNSTILFGKTVLRAIHAPGHTAESIIYLLEDVAFTGDTLFVDGVGRPDLGENTQTATEQLWTTFHRTILMLPPKTKFLPGHYGEKTKIYKNVPIMTSMGELKMKYSEFPVFTLDKDAFIKWALQNESPRPSNFSTIKNINSGLETVSDPDELRDLEAGPNRCAIA